MLLLLPFLILALVLSAVVCYCCAYTLPAGAFMYILWLLVFFVGLLLLYAILLCVTSLFIDMKKPQERPSRFHAAIMKYSVGLMNLFSRVRIHMSGEKLIPDGRFLLVGNHRSNYDPVVSIWAFRKYDLAFISKPGNFKIPVAGPFVHKCCFLALDRDNDRAALRTILDAAALIKADATSVAIYPEGTRNCTSEPLLPFRNGAFKIAQRAKAPVVVMTIRNSEKIAHNFPLRHTDVYVDIREVISAERVCSLKTNELGEEIRRCMLCESD